MCAAISKIIRDFDCYQANDATLATPKNLEMTRYGKRFVVYDLSPEEFRWLNKNLHRYEDETNEIYSYELQRGFALVPVFNVEDVKEELKKSHEIYIQVKDQERNYAKMSAHRKAIQLLINYLLRSRDPDREKHISQALEELGQDFIDPFFSVYDRSEPALPYHQPWDGPVPLKNFTFEPEMILGYFLAKKVTMTSENAKRILELGIFFNDPELAKKSLDLDPTLANQDYNNSLGSFPFLSLAILWKSENIAKLLIEKGAEFNVKCENPMNQPIKLLFREKQQLEQIFPFFQFLVEKGLNVEVTRGYFGLEVPLIEWIYFHPEIPPSYSEYLLYETKMPLTNTMIHHMKMVLQEKPKLGRALHQRGLITDQEFEQIHHPPELGSREDLLVQAKQLKESLDHEFKIYHGCPARIDPVLMTKARSLKKGMKRILKENPQDLEMGTCHALLTKTYDAIIKRHPVFRILQVASRELRSQEPKNPSLRLRRLFSLWSGTESFTVNEQKNMSLCSPRSVFEKMRQNVVTTLFRYRKELLPHLTWFHGTKSSALPGILKAGGLLPMGELIKKGFVPFNGENNGSELALNQNLVSGEILTSTFEETLQNGYYHDAATRLLISLLYAKKKTGYGFNDKQFDKEHAKKLASLASIEDLIQNMAKGNFSQQKFSGIRMAILRLRQIDSQIDESLAPAKEVLAKTRDDPSLSRENQNRLAQLYETFTRDLSMLNENERDWIEQSYPILFASSSLDPTTDDENSPQEYLVSEALLGRDIQYAFTEENRQESLREILAPYGIQVYPFEVAFYLETLNMARGSERVELIQSGASREMQIAEILESEILPHYSTPFPEHPFYKEKEQLIYLKNPYYGGDFKYQDYITAFEQGRILPRNIHGRVHAIRVAIAAKMLQNFLNPTPLRVSEAITAAAHDWMRQDEGPDHWDHESGEKYFHWARKYGASSKEAAIFKEAIALKDPPNRKFTSSLQKTIHDADCLEIHRVLHHPSQFHRDALCFHCPDEKKHEQFIDEWHRFCYITDSESFKKMIEWEPENSYIEVVRVFQHFAHLFPTLANCFQRELKALDEMPPLPGLIQCAQSRLEELEVREKRSDENF